MPDSEGVFKLSIIIAVVLPLVLLCHPMFRDLLHLKQMVTWVSRVPGLVTRSVGGLAVSCIFPLLNSTTHLMSCPSTVCAWCSRAKSIAIGMTTTCLLGVISNYVAVGTAAWYLVSWRVQDHPHSPLCWKHYAIISKSDSSPDCRHP